MADNPTNTALSEAVKNGTAKKLQNALSLVAAIRVAQMMERTESPRETKALAISLVDLISQCEATDVCDSYADTPLKHILAEAEKALS